MDTDDINTAQKIWKWGIGGLAYSSTGVNGTWTTGITMDGYIVGSMISANSIVGEQIQANTIKASNLEIATQEKIKNATDVQTVDTMIKAGLGEFEVSMSKNFVTVENATSQIQQATEVAVKDATQNIIDNAVSESLESVNEQLNGKLNDYTDDILTPAIQNKAEEILNNANNYTIEKLSTYATKSEVSSGIKQAIDNINLSVSEKYETKEQSEIKIKEAINDVAIGSVNRVLGSSETKSHQFKGGSNEAWVAYDMISDFSDNTVTVSFKYKFVGTVENGSRLLFQSQFTDNSNVIKYQPTYTLIDATSYTELNVTDEVVFTTKEFTNMNKGLRSKFRFRADGMTGTLTISEAQLKIGNKITEWSIAPEDIINTSEDFVVKQLTNYSTKTETKSAIDLVKDEINLGVSSLYETKANVETQINNVKTELNTSIGEKANSVDVYNKTEVYTKAQTDSAIKIAKDSIELGVKNTYETKTNVTSKVNSAISTASSDATTKANNALSSAKSYADTKKTEAINSANNTLNTTIANYYTKNETDSRINMTKDSINLSVSNLKTEVMSATFTNLLYNSDFNKVENDFPKHYTRTNATYVYNGGWLCPEGGKTIHVYTIGSGATWQGFYSHNVKVNKDQTMTASVYVATENKDAITGHLGIEIEWLNAENQRITVSHYSFNLDQNHEWKRVSVTGHAPEGTVYARVYCWNSNDGATWWGKPMLQIGSVCTAWNKGGDFESFDERLSNAEIKITDESITNVVKQSFYTKEETEGQITSKGYQTSSQVQQTVDALQLKFTQSGGYNRIRNGIFKNGTSQWSSWGSPTISTKSDNGHSYGKSLVLTTTGTNQGVQQTVSDLCSGKTYTLSAYVYTWAANDCGIQIYCGGNYYSSKVPTAGTWQRISLTFKATSTSATVQIGRGGWGANGQHLFTAIQFEEGELATTYTPHPSEVYDGITTIDKDGVTVKGSNGAYTNFNSTGMNSFNNSGQQTLGIRNGGITFHPYSSNQLGAYITQSALHGNSAAANGLAISTANNGTYISLGTSSLSDANTTLNMDQALTVSANDNFQPKGINLWKDTHAHGYGIRQLSHLRLAGSGAIQFDYLNTSPSTIYEAVDGGHSLYVMGGYQTHIGCMDGEGTPKGVIWMQNSTNTHSYTHWNFHNYTMYNMKTATSYANTLSRKVNEVYGVNSNVEGIRYLYKNVELINGKAVRSIPSAYVGCDYDIVSIVCTGQGRAWVELENNDNFQINGECKAVNVEIIIYPKDEVMTMCSVNCTESPKLTLPNEVNGEVAPLISNYIGDDN